MIYVGNTGSKSRLLKDFGDLPTASLNSNLEILIVIDEIHFTFALVLICYFIFLNYIINRNYTNIVFLVHHIQYSLSLIIINHY